MSCGCGCNGAGTCGGTAARRVGPFPTLIQGFGFDVSTGGDAGSDATQTAELTAAGAAVGSYVPGIGTAAGAAAGAAIGLGVDAYDAVQSFVGSLGDHCDGDPDVCTCVEAWRAQGTSLTDIASQFAQKSGPVWDCVLGRKGIAPPPPTCPPGFRELIPGVCIPVMGELPGTCPYPTVWDSAHGRCVMPGPDALGLPHVLLKPPPPQVPSGGFKTLLHDPHAPKPVATKAAAKVKPMSTGAKVAVGVAGAGLAAAIAYAVSKVI